MSRKGKLTMLKELKKAYLQQMFPQEGEKVPRVRFEGFSGEWEKFVIGDTIAYEQPQKYIVESTEYSDDYATPVLTAGQTFILGYTDEYEGIYQANINSPVIIFDDFTTSFHLVDFPFKIKSSAIKLLTLKKDVDFDFNFLYYSMCCINYVPSNHERHWISKYSMLQRYAPIFYEQVAIGNFFRKLDELIACHQCKLDSLKALKKACLQQMFPQNGENVPRLRVEGFTEGWERKKLGEIGKTQSGIGFSETEQGGTEGVPFFKVSDMNLQGNENIMQSSNNYVCAVQIGSKRWNVITSVPAIIFAKVGAALLLDRKRLVYEPFLIDNNLMAYLFDETWDIDFAKALFETIDLSKYAQIGALPSFNGSDIEAIEIIRPPHSEQTTIGEFFRTLDNLITLHS